MPPHLKEPAFQEAIRYEWGGDELSFERTQRNVRKLIGRTPRIVGGMLEMATDLGFIYAAKGDWIVKSNSGEIVFYKDETFRRLFDI